MRGAHTVALTPPPGRETIAALATVPGVGALSVVRISGPGTTRLLSALTGDDKPMPLARRATLRRLRNQQGEVLDEAIVLRYVGPHSYTGEDGADIICHGGWVTATRILEALVASGAAPAEPGEFTRRAVLNGRLDLLQAEAVNDLIRAESSASANLALQQLDGGLSAKIEALRAQLLELEALIAYDVDFPEEDDGPVSRDRIAQATTATCSVLEALIETTPGGELIRHGAVVAIVGPPNAGKSSLFNALLGRKRALVTDVPGTTRDALEAVLDASPVPIRLVDTAGMRDTEDEVERLGVEVSRDFLKNASVVLACGDNQEVLAAAVAMAQPLATGQVIAVWTKRDLQHTTWRPEKNVVAISARDGTGLDVLLQRVSDVLSRETHLPQPDMPRVAHARHREVLERARTEVLEFQDAWSRQQTPVVVAAVHLREALRILEELIGAVDVDEILGRVFSAFCVGK